MRAETGGNETLHREADGSSGKFRPVLDYWTMVVPSLNMYSILLAIEVFFYYFIKIYFGIFYGHKYMTNK